MQSVMPRLMEAQDGSTAPQSQHRSLPVTERSSSTRLQDTVNNIHSQQCQLYTCFSSSVSEVTS